VKGWDHRAVAGISDQNQTEPDEQHAKQPPSKTEQKAQQSTRNQNKFRNSGDKAQTRIFEQKDSKVSEHQKFQS
jgi:hypothetical protein